MTFFVRMTDSFMSNWGRSQGMKNVFVVECDTLDQAETIERNAKNRSEMKYVKIVDKFPRSRSGVLYSTEHYDNLGRIWKHA